MLDIELEGEPVYAVADRLQQLGVPSELVSVDAASKRRKVLEITSADPICRRRRSQQQTKSEEVSHVQ